MTTLRIATLNCLNLALPGRPVYEGYAPYSGDEYLAKTQWLGTMFDRLAADFILVQEVFHEQALADAVRQTVSQGRDWSLAAPFADENNAQPRLGLLWRRPWQPRLESIVDLPPGCAVPVPELAPHARFSRPLLLARVALPPPFRQAGAPAELGLINVHLKSRRPEFADGEDRDDPRAEARAQLRALIKRGAEAAALRRLLVELARSERIALVVAGDFNDEPNAVTTRIVADSSWRRDDGLPRECALFNALEVELRSTPGRGRDTAFTILHGAEPERIDHVLVSTAFVAGQSDALGYVERVELLNDHLVERRAGRLPSAGVRNGPDLGRILSDHGAVCVSIVFGSPEAAGGVPVA